MWRYRRTYYEWSHWESPARVFVGVIVILILGYILWEPLKEIYHSVDAERLASETGRLAIMGIQKLKALVSP